MFLAVLAASLYFLPENLIDYIPFADGATFVKLQKMPGMAVALCGIVLSFLISVLAFLRCRRKERVWLTYGMIFTAAMLLFFAVSIPHRAADTAKKDLADGFRNALIQQEKVTPDSTVLYKDTKINGLF